MKRKSDYWGGYKSTTQENTISYHHSILEMIHLYDGYVTKILLPPTIRHFS